MTDPILVRELSPLEKPHFAGAKTGDTLPDGTVLLWRSDMDRMGLSALRHWLEHTVIEESAVVAVGDSIALHGQDEEYTG